MLEYLPFVGSIGSLVLGISKWNSLNLTFRILIAHLLVVALCEIGMYYLFLQGSNNLWLVHIYTVLEFIAYGTMFYFMLSKARAILALIILFSIGSIYNSAYVQDLSEYNTYARGIGALLLILFSVVYLMYRLTEVHDSLDDDLPETWVSAAILLYFSSITLTVFSFNLSTQRSLITFIWDTHLIVSCIFYSIFGLAIWNKAKAYK